MKSGTRGASTSITEVTRLSDDGIWLSLDGDELFLPFALFPWFRSAKLTDIRNVERPAPDRLRWPALDIDLAVESIRHPERFPLVSSATVAR
jgi:hypothetical protein